MGEVYCAEDTRLDREVVVKVLPAKVASDAKRNMSELGVSLEGRSLGR